MTASEPEPAAWRRWLAYFWFLWGASLSYWGLRTHEVGLFRWAVASYSRAARVWPGFSAAYYRRGELRSRELHEHAEAIRDLTRAIAIAPEWPDSYLQRGLIQRFHGDGRAALADLNQFVALAPDSSWREEAERQIRQIEDDLGNTAPPA